MMPLGEAFYRGRTTAIQAAVDAAALDGILLLDPYNVIYASGFIHSVSERPIGLYVPAAGAPVLFVPLLEQENAAATWIGDIRTYFEFPGEENPIAWMLREANAQKIGIDAPPYTLHTDSRIVPTDIVNRMRWIKQPEEMTVTKQAARYADYCLEIVKERAAAIIRDGGTELDILHECTSATLAKMQTELGDTYGRRALKVTGTVHSGPRAALPHGEPIDRKPQHGETLIAGIGAMVGGYHAESGATFVVGDADDETMRCLHVAAACDRAAVDALRQGTTCAAVNAAALNVLHDAGLSDAIRHRIGHGMGLQGHESPWLAPGDETVVRAGMVFSNEPGIYRPGRDGYRTISSMTATENGADVISRFLQENPPEARILQL